ncbi:hypothetical protein CEP53_013046 [Fusarium sp. AF-6]|nr:hypothetical protein CEP53_013046 [Fusarium sp. AF-6]
MLRAAHLNLPLTRTMMLEGGSAELGGLHIGDKRAICNLIVMMDQQYAYVTGAASGCGLAISTFLVEKGIKVFLTDFDEKNLRVAAERLRSPFAVVNVADWESQVKGFTQAVSQFGRIDYVYPIAGIGENSWIPPLS